jgi:hypothetical protein
MFYVYEHNQSRPEMLAIHILKHKTTCHRSII